MVAYHKPEGLADPGALKLAALAGYLVDAPKQGYVLSEQAWNIIRSKASGKIQLTPLTYKSNDSTVPNLKNIVDYLKFVVATDEKDRILSQFHKDWSDGSSYDKTLSAPYSDAMERYKTDKNEIDEVKKAEKLTGRNILERLKQDINSIKSSFQSDLNRCKDGDQKFEDLMWAIYEQLRSVEPLRDADHEITRRFDYERGEQFSNWSRLRVSCLYYRWTQRIIAWYAAGTELAKIKADSKGPIRFVTQSVHQIMKPDSGLVMRVAQRGREDEGDASFEELDEWDTVLTVIS